MCVGTFIRGSPTYHQHPSVASGPGFYGNGFMGSSQPPSGPFKPYGFSSPPNTSKMNFQGRSSSAKSADSNYSSNRSPGATPRVLAVFIFPKTNGVFCSQIPTQNSKLMKLLQAHGCVHHLVDPLTNIAPVWAEMDTVVEALLKSLSSLDRTSIVASDNASVMPYKILYDGPFIIAKRNLEISPHSEKTIKEVSNRVSSNDYYPDRRISELNHQTHAFKMKVLQRSET